MKINFTPSFINLVPPSISLQEKAYLEEQLKQINTLSETKTAVIIEDEAGRFYEQGVTQSFGEGLRELLVASTRSIRMQP